MKIGEVMKKLEDLKEKYGDIDVGTYSDDFGSHEPIDDIYIVEDKGRNNRRYGDSDSLSRPFVGVS